MITFTTDFGAGSPYVAAMKGAALSIFPSAILVDVTHDVPPQDVLQGALVLAQVADYFPPRTIHVAVVDPGVGTERRIVFMEIGSQRFVAPDNGLLTLVAEKQTPSRVREVTNRELWRPTVSSTFHGRDVMAPVAAHLAAGEDPESVGPPVDDFVRLSLPEVGRTAGGLEGVVLSIDTFGNVITNVTAEWVAELAADKILVVCGAHAPTELVKTYGQRPAGTLVALIGSTGRLELAAVNGSAARNLGVRVGDRVEVVAERAETHGR